MPLIVYIMKRSILILFFLCSVFAGFTQQKDTVLVQAEVFKGDTLMQKELNEVEVFPKIRTKYQARRYNRLIRYVQKVYPYAQTAAIKMKEYEQVLIDLQDNPKEQRRVMKQVEEEIYAEWGEDLKQLTYLQGGILLKLIDRQTGDSSFELVKEFRGGFRAFFYQSFARVFGFNLKDRYNPKEDSYDRQIEHIVHLIENGQL